MVVPVQDSPQVPLAAEVKEVFHATMPSTRINAAAVMVMYVLLMVGCKSVLSTVHRLKSSAQVNQLA
jgi:hypothetical protein